MLGITKLMLAPECSAQIQLGVAFIGKAHTSMELNGSISGIQQGLGRLGLGHAAGNLCILIQGLIANHSGSVVNQGSR
mgnify:FL=1